MDSPPGHSALYDINADLIVALEGSDIIANAFEGRGGNIQISTQGLFLAPNSEINASSAFGVDGVVDIKTPEVDPNSGLFALPDAVVDLTGLVAQSCARQGGSSSSELTVTGRGGLPPNPGDAQSSETVLADLSTNAVHGKANVTSSNLPSLPTSSSPKRIVEATGWVVDRNGQVVLTANARNFTPHSPWLTSAECDRN